VLFNLRYFLSFFESACEGKEGDFCLVLPVGNPADRKQKEMKPFFSFPSPLQFSLRLLAVDGNHEEEEEEEPIDQITSRSSNK